MQTLILDRSNNREIHLHGGSEADPLGLQSHVNQLEGVTELHMFQFEHRNGSVYFLLSKEVTGATLRVRGGAAQSGADTLQTLTTASLTAFRPRGTSVS